MNILILEPDRKVSLVYQRALTAAGHNVRIEHHAQDAITSIDKSQPDIVIVELQLIRHGGMEFLYELRSYSEWLSMKVILLTMVPSHQLILSDKSKKELGIVEHLYKPETTLEQLVCCVGGHG